MPTETDTNRQFFLEVDGELKPVEMGVTIEECAEIVQDVENAIHNPEFFKGCEVTFKMSYKQHKRLKRVLQSVLPRYYTNNWRKMHGLSMVRRMKK